MWGGLPNKRSYVINGRHSDVEVESKAKTEDGIKSKDKEEGRYFLIFEIDWLNYWVRTFKIVKASQLA